MTRPQSKTTTTQQHTPGPMVRIGGITGCRMSHEVDLGGGVVAYVPDRIGSEKRARLIAAAPDMLAAIVMACGVLDAFRNGEANQEDLDDLSRRLDAAIAKATGAQ